MESTQAARRSRWNARYEADGAVFGLEPNRFVAAELADLTPCRILDLGSGQGRNAVWLATRGHEVTAVDLSTVGVEQTLAAAARHDVDVDARTEDLTTWSPPAGAYDVVLLAYLQVEAPARRTIHAGAVRAVAPGGGVLLVAHHLDNVTHGVGGPQKPELLYTEDDLRGDFAGLVVDRCEKVRREVPGAGTALDVVVRARRPRPDS